MVPSPGIGPSLSALRMKARERAQDRRGFRVEQRDDRQDFREERRDDRRDYRRDRRN